MYIYKILGKSITCFAIIMVLYNHRQYINNFLHYYDYGIEKNYKPF